MTPLSCARGPYSPASNAPGYLGIDSAGPDVANIAIQAEIAEQEAAVDTLRTHEAWITALETL
jgi:hypothetical protein